MYMGKSIFMMARFDGNVTIAHVIVSVVQLVLNDPTSTLFMEYLIQKWILVTLAMMDDDVRFQKWTDQSECEKVNLWLKITNMIGHHDS